MQSFGSPSKTLADWATYVQDKWDNIADEVKAKTGTAQDGMFIIYNSKNVKSTSNF